MALKKILVADDSLTIQKVIRLALSSEGYEIESVNNGQELAQRLAVFRPDIVLVDVTLPGPSPFDTRRDTLHSSQARWILMSSAFEQVNDKLIGELQFHGRLIKPFDPAYLRKVLTEALNANPVAAPVSPARGLIETDEGTLSSLSKDIWGEETPTMGGLVLEQPSLSQEIPVPGSAAASSGGTSVGKGSDDIAQLAENTVKMSGIDTYQWNVQETGRVEEPELVPPASYSEDPGTRTGIQGHSPQVGPGMEPITTDQVQKLVQRELALTVQKLAREMLPDIAEKILKEEIHKLLATPPI